MAIDEQDDLIPTNFVIKVFQTKELAEENDELNALKIFNNGIDGDLPDPLMANGSQFIHGTVTDTETNKLKDSNAKFGSRLIGYKVTNINDSTTVAPATITEWKSETELVLDANIFPDVDDLYNIERPGHFFIFQKYFYRIEATDPVSGFIIDWDDGEDNSPGKANRQTIKLDSPQYYTIVEHTYTHHGKHYPMVRTISPEGFYSKWYVSHDAVIANALRSIETYQLDAGQNNYSQVSVDLPQGPPVDAGDLTTAFLCRMPEFAPANMPPVGVLKVDRTSVFSGIDNAVIPVHPTGHASAGLPDGNWKAYAYVDRTGGTTLSAMTGGIEVIYKTTLDRILKETINPHSDISTAAGRAFPEVHGTDGYLKEILSVKLVEMREGTSVSPDRLGPDERIYIQVYEQGETQDPLTDDPATFVSLGNPIQTLDRPGFSVFADGSQSQTRASNVSISKYWFEEGKLAGTLRAEPNGALQISDAFGFTVDNFDQTKSHLRTYYSFNHHNILMDATTKRFPDDERLYRLQVEDTSSSTRTDAASYYDYDTPIPVSVGKINMGAGLNETTVTLTIDASTGLLPGDVFKLTPHAAPDPATEELMRIIKVNIETEIVVERGFQGTEADTYDDNADIFVISDNGRLGDSLTRSFIEHFDPVSYYWGNRPTSLLSRALLLYGNLPDAAGGIAPGDVQWTNRMAQNNINSGDFGFDEDDTGDSFLVFGGTKHSGKPASTNKTELTGAYSADGFSAGVDTSHDTNPCNYILYAKTDRFNKIHFRMNNDYTGIALNARDSDWYESFEGTDNIYTNMMAWYTAKTAATAAGYMWKALSITDGTSTGESNSSLRRSGTLYFDMPEDWVATKSASINSGTWLGPVGEDSVGGTFPSTIEAPEDIWKEDMYGLLIGLAVNETDVNSAKIGQIRGYSVIAYNNLHSQAIKIVDPHHKSLNDVAISQDISFSRAGKYIEITDRIGRTEIRKIGAAGGQLTFGGVELVGNFTTTKAALLRYQRKGTPVYLDVERVNGDFTRVYGVISDMSETFPAGKALPKFGITMKVEYIAEYDSSGNWISNGLMALGGEIIDEPRYIL